MPVQFGYVTIRVPLNSSFFVFLTTCNTVSSSKHDKYIRAALGAEESGSGVFFVGNSLDEIFPPWYQF